MFVVDVDDLVLDKDGVLRVGVEAQDIIMEDADEHDLVLEPQLLLQHLEGEQLALDHAGRYR